MRKFRADIGIRISKIEYRTGVTETYDNFLIRWRLFRIDRGQSSSYYEILYKSLFLLLTVIALYAVNFYVIIFLFEPTENKRFEFASEKKETQIWSFCDLIIFFEHVRKYKNWKVILLSREHVMWEFVTRLMTIDWEVEERFEKNINESWFSSNILKVILLK